MLVQTSIALSTEIPQLFREERREVGRKPRVSFAVRIIVNKNTCLKFVAYSSILDNLKGLPGGSQMGKNLLAMQDIWVRSLGWEDFLEKGMTIHSGILAWRIQWTEELTGYSPWGRKKSDTDE